MSTEAAPVSKNDSVKEKLTPAEELARLEEIHLPRKRAEASAGGSETERKRAELEKNLAESEEEVRKDRVEVETNEAFLLQVTADIQELDRKIEELNSLFRGIDLAKKHEASFNALSPLLLSKLEELRRSIAEQKSQVASMPDTRGILRRPNEEKQALQDELTALETQSRLMVDVYNTMTGYRADIGIAAAVGAKDEVFLSNLDQLPIEGEEGLRYKDSLLAFGELIEDLDEEEKGKLRYVISRGSIAKESRVRELGNLGDQKAKKESDKRWAIDATEASRAKLAASIEKRRLLQEEIDALG